ncbi:MAG: cupin domain-containing protein [Phycisphaeraceae bacterium]
MTTASQASSDHVPPVWEVERFWVLGQGVTLLADHDNTTGSLTLIEAITPPYADGPPPHYHNNCDETFHLLEGRLELMRGDEWRTLQPGQAASVPRNVVHTFRNPSSTPARFLSAYTPGGFGRFFRDFGAPADDFATPPPNVDARTIERLLATSANYGMIIPSPYT